MNTKLLLLLGVVIGLVLLATLDPGTERPGPEDLSQLIDSGHFVLELNGIPILEETYTLEFHNADGYLRGKRKTFRQRESDARHVIAPPAAF